MRTSRTIFGLAPALGFSLIPSLTCPACLPALASVLGAAGLTFLAQREYLIWFNLVALGIALTLLARSERKWISWPLAIAGLGAIAVMLGKFVWSSSLVWWMGLGVFVMGSVWSTLSRKSSSAAGCNECKSLEMEN